MNVAYEFPMTETALTSVFGGQGFGIWEAFFLYWSYGQWYFGMDLLYQSWQFYV